MNKIEFKNLPDTTTPLSAEVLNQLQDNIDNEKTNFQQLGETITDANELISLRSGMFSAHLITNVPDDAWYFIEQITVTSKVHEYWDNWIVQKIYNLNNKDKNYIRKKIDGVWQNWEQITNDYSNSEIIVGTWMGKPLYRKCYSANIASSNPTNIDRNLTRSNIKIKNSGGMIYASNNDGMSLGCYLNANWYNGLYLSDHLQLYCSPNVLNGIYDIWIEYTKASD